MVSRCFSLDKNDVSSLGILANIGLPGGEGVQINVLNFAEVDLFERLLFY